MPEESARTKEAPLPSIPGMTIRRFRGPEDFVPMAEVITRSREADGFRLAKSADALAAEFDHATDFNPATDVLLAEPRSTAVATSSRHSGLILPPDCPLAQTGPRAHAGQKRAWRSSSVTPGTSASSKGP